MIPSTIANQTVTRHRPATVADHGGLVPDWADTTPAQIAGCSFQPSPGGEDLANRTAAQTVGVLYAPPGADLAAGDLVEIPGRPGRLRVTGEPERWATGRAVDHVRASLTSWEG